ncbi:MAG: sugar ABC transporter permease [Alicyclobacillus sp.]|nr:sugar ABC transporter permease [Alicyclobacillus sp.]
MSSQIATVSVTKKKRRRTLGSAGVLPYVLITPGVILLLAWSYFPSLYAVAISFTKYQPGISLQWTGIDNYRQVFADPEFWHSVLRSFEYLLVVPVLMIVPLLFAVLLNQKIPGVGVFRALFFIPVVLSMVVVSIVFKQVFATNGFLNDALLAVHAVKQAIPWLTIPSIAMLAVMAVTVWKGIGWYMLVYLAGLQSISPELYEAAKIDGAGWIRQVWYITIPLIWPFMLFVMIMSTLGAMQVFTEVYQITAGGPINSTTTMLYYLFQQSFQNYNYGYGAAIGIFIWFILMVLSFIEFRFFNGERWRDER